MHHLRLEQSETTLTPNIQKLYAQKLKVIFFVLELQKKIFERKIDISISRQVSFVTLNLMEIIF